MSDNVERTTTAIQIADASIYPAKRPISIISEKQSGSDNVGQTSDLEAGELDSGHYMKKKQVSPIVVRVIVSDGIMLTIMRNRNILAGYWHGMSNTFNIKLRSESLNSLYRLALQSTGVIYGDIGTSPLYVYSSTFTSNPSYDDLVGALSIIIWTLTLIVTLKYVFIVLRADDDGEGGTFAVYSLLTRYVCPGLRPSAKATSK